MVRQRLGVAGALSRRQGCSDALVSSPSPFLVMDLGLVVGRSGRGSSCGLGGLRMLSYSQS